MGRYSA
ncbi:hypothetical protein LINPERHAP1_LOCUS13827 [Linum perenne]